MLTNRAIDCETNIISMSESNNKIELRVAQPLHKSELDLLWETLKNLQGRFELTVSVDVISDINVDSDVPKDQISLSSVSSSQR